MTLVVVMIIAPVVGYIVLAICGMVMVVFSAVYIVVTKDDCVGRRIKQVLLFVALSIQMSFIYLIALFLSIFIIAYYYLVLACFFTLLTKKQLK